MLRISAAAGFAVLATGAFAQTKWDMPTGYSDGTFQTQNVRSFVEDVARLSGNKLAITVHSNGSLVKMPEMKRSVQSGQVPMAEMLVSVLSNENAIFGFDSVPGLVGSYAEARKLYNAARAQLAETLDKQGLVLLYSVAWPPQGVYTAKPITALADLKGTKFRSFNPATARFAELIGAVPTTIQVPEIAQAFRTGVLDAMITSGATGVDSQAWDFLKFFYDTQAFLPQNIVIANKRAYSALPDDVKTAIQNAARVAEDRGWKMSEELNGTHKKTLAEKGIQVLPPTDTMKAELKKIGETMAAEWAKRAGAEGEKILAEFRR
ncbi:MAG: TRAP transporter substrate-binding protein [Methylobacterium sp.]|nr:TRAP transporter substrate-binding protein [Methylobacterium sp.]MCA3599169.1 TRAP transporter substrate-binding protein [Methylobacterium sp.]MCA3604061.1 TRAP transporter substrate-binding protein [Methylobacterium sp.]MCA3605027.1 TRAP transporter substrate-binding protein [Methylobacterium sp.]MCA3609760.1 TRAP transporter substrate-binding protein [Methylobacterium sp.]